MTAKTKTPLHKVPDNLLDQELKRRDIERAKNRHTKHRLYLRELNK